MQLGKSQPLHWPHLNITLVILLLLPFCAAPDDAVEPPKHALVWPIAGQPYRDWVVHRYVDLDASAGLRDCFGQRGCLALTYDGHTGTDFNIADFAAMRRGVTVRAALAGQVVRVQDAFGDAQSPCDAMAWNVVEIEHVDGFRTVYGHLRQHSAQVREGDWVEAGRALGLVGNSGCSETPHLHFEWHDPRGRFLDPFSLAAWQNPLPSQHALRAMSVVLLKGDVDDGLLALRLREQEAWSLGDTATVVLSAAGGRSGDRLSVWVDGPDGESRRLAASTLTKTYGHSIWRWTLPLHRAGAWGLRLDVNGQTIAQRRWWVRAHGEQ